jgi:hypothetical protein
MGLLGKTLNDRSTVKKEVNEEEPIIRITNQDEVDLRNKIDHRKFNHLKSLLEQEKILTKVNRQKLLETWIEAMKKTKEKKLLEEITLQNQVFER